MDNIKNDSYYIEKIVNDLWFISFHMADVTLEEFGKNDILLDSMMFRMIQISENSKRLTDDYKLKKANVPWNSISRLRNRIVHDYGNVDLNVVYDTLKNDVPELLNMFD